MRPLTVDDLNDYGRQRLEEDYASANRRARCAREDFATGWIACAIRFGIKTLFKVESLEPNAGVRV